MGAMRPIAPNDFQFDQTSDLRTVKLLNIVDEFTRECGTIDAARSITADDVVKRFGSTRRRARRRATCAWTTVPPSRSTSLTRPARAIATFRAFSARTAMELTCASQCW